MNLLSHPEGDHSDEAESPRDTMERLQVDWAELFPIVLLLDSGKTQAHDHYDTMGSVNSVVDGGTHVIRPGMDEVEVAGPDDGVGFEVVDQEVADKQDAVDAVGDDEGNGGANDNVEGASCNDYGVDRYLESDVPPVNAVCEIRSLPHSSISTRNHHQLNGWLRGGCCSETRDTPNEHYEGYLDDDEYCHHHDRVWTHPHLVYWVQRLPWQVPRYVFA